MQTYQNILMCLRQNVKGSLVGKFSSGVVLGLLLFVATFIVNVPGASANARTTCSAGDHPYSVVGGDTLSSIGSRYGTNWSALALHNHVANPNLIYNGQIVCVPAQTQKALQTKSARMYGIWVKEHQKRVSTPVTPHPTQPTPSTPTPTPTSGGSVTAMIYQVFGSYGAAAVNIARCESGLNPAASNPSGAAGLFQIMPGTWAGTSEAGQSPYNAYANIVAAHQIFVRDGYSWREWSCQP